nr:GTP-binding protein [Jiella mangrovi]
MVTGFLGAGKTTLINALLQAGHGRRIAAIVNDFGSINIDAEILAEANDEVIGLKNGCICCSLQGDLLRTLKTVLTRKPQPDAIVIEASGVADPRGIVEALLDPVIWQSANLDSVLCVVDAEDVSDGPERLADELWLAQLGAADFVFLAKTSRLEAAAISDLRAALALQTKRLIFDPDREGLPLDVLLAPFADRQRDPPAAPSPATRAFRFETFEWRCRSAVTMAAFQAAIGRLAPDLVRAKGFLRFDEQPGRRFLFQMVGSRASVSPAADHSGEAGCSLVLIGERTRFDPEKTRHILDSLSAGGSKRS